MTLTPLTNNDCSCAAVREVSTWGNRSLSCRNIYICFAVVKGFLLRLSFVCYDGLFGCSAEASSVQKHQRWQLSGRVGNTGGEETRELIAFDIWIIYYYLAWIINMLLLDSVSVYVTVPTYLHEDRLALSGQLVNFYRLAEEENAVSVYKCRACTSTSVLL